MNPWSPSDQVEGILNPYTETCYLEYKGHMNAIMSISTEATREWIALSMLLIFLLHFHSGWILDKSIIGCGYLGGWNW